MQLSSSAFSGGSAIPRRFTCDGDDLSPPFDWEATPPTARSFVLLCDDPDAPAGKWHHWPSTTLLLNKPDLPKAPATTAARRDRSRRSTTSTGRAMAVPARPAVMDGIVITFVCWPFRSTTYRSAPSPPAARSREKHASMLSPKRPSSGSISDNCFRQVIGKGRQSHATHYGGH